MQTFLPHADMQKSAAVLDRQRLGKQRVEGYQILRTLLGVSSGWQNHPAVKMWAGYEYCLKVYTLECITEWVRRGYKNSIELPYIPPNCKLPWWFGDERVHGSHRSNLLRKAPEYYGKFGWADCPAAAYWWPGQRVGYGQFGRAPGA